MLYQVRDTKNGCIVDRNLSEEDALIYQESNNVFAGFDKKQGHHYVVEPMKDGGQT